MANIRVFHNKDNPYVQLNKKTLEISSLSWEAKGLWAYLLSRPDDWNTNVKNLSRTFEGGEKRVRRILRELMENQLCHYVQRRTTFESGRPKWGRGDYLIFESPREFQKMFAHGQKGSPQNDRSQNGDSYKERSLLNNDSTKKDIPKGISQDVAIAPSLPSFSSDVEKLCKHLIEKIQSHGVKFKDPRETKTTWNQWRNDMDKLLRIDNHSALEIVSLIDFAHADDFWCQNILCPKKLRKHADKLLLQKAQKEKKPPKEQREKLNREGAKKIVDILKKNPIHKDFLIDCCSTFIELGRRSHPNKVVINYSEHGFQDQLENELRRMDLFKYLT